jgi:glycosyltransferase involved in cell wall biosynthesis
MSVSVYIPQISPIPKGMQRPLWSVMIPTYNCANSLQQTLESVLAQDPGPELMQIQVVDDCSTKDDPEAVVKTVGQGRVEFFRQSGNVGAIANFNTCLWRSCGQLIHILHGDDLVNDSFYSCLERPLIEHEAVGAAFCRQIYIDEYGHQRLITRLEQPNSGMLKNALELLAVSNRIPPPSIVIKRWVYEALGGYDLRLFHAADWEMWVRIAAHYPIWYEVEPLAIYRVHATSDTSRLYQTGANMQNRRECISICHNYLPVEQANLLTRKALGYSMIYGLRLVSRFLRARQGRLALIQLREVVLCGRQLLQPHYKLTPQ